MAAASLQMGEITMAEAKYESKTGRIAAPDCAIYSVLSNLENLNRVRDLIPQDKVKEIEIASDYIKMAVDGLAQKIVIRIVEKEEYKTIKFGAENIPIAVNAWIQLKQVADNDTRMRITLHADIPMMFRLMLDNKMQQGLDQAVDMLCQLPYTHWS